MCERVESADEEAHATGRSRNLRVGSFEDHLGFCDQRVGSDLLYGTLSEIGRRLLAIRGGVVPEPLGLCDGGKRDAIDVAVR
jgi:hypothetical protein